jgi:hypothetical protein
MKREIQIKIKLTTLNLTFVNSTFLSLIEKKDPKYILKIVEPFFIFFFQRSKREKQIRILFLHCIKKQ